MFESGAAHSAPGFTLYVLDGWPMSNPADNPSEEVDTPQECSRI